MLILFTTELQRISGCGSELFHKSFAFLTALSNAIRFQRVGSARGRSSGICRFTPDICVRARNKPHVSKDLISSLQGSWRCFFLEQKVRLQRLPWQTLFFLFQGMRGRDPLLPVAVRIAFVFKSINCKR